MRVNNLTTKIKIVGILLILTITTSILTTIIINKKYENSPQLINTAGKQRMFTQKISKDIYYAYKLKSLQFNNLNNDIEIFKKNLSILNKKEPFDNIKINIQLNKVNTVWNEFYENINSVKDNIILKGRYYSLENIKANNIILLDEIDKLVNMYIEANEEITNYLHIFQIISLIIIILIISYSILMLKKTSDYINQFLEYGQSIVSGDTNNMKSLKIEGKEIEDDVVQASSILNDFMQKVNCAVEESNNALEYSQKASQKLEEISDDFGDILDEFDLKVDTENLLDKSEDIIIESNEDLLKSTRKLQKLKNELDKLLLSCK